MASEKDLKNQVKKLGNVISDKERELKKLQNISEDLEKQKAVAVKAEDDLKALKIQHEHVSKESQRFREQIEAFDPSGSSEALKEELKTKKSELAEEQKKVNQLGKEISDLTRKNQSLVEGDKSNTGLLEDLKSRDKKIENLIKEKEVLEKKVAKTEGDFPKLPIPHGKVESVEKISEVQMDSDERKEAHRIKFKDGSSPVLLQVRVKSGKCIEADYSPIV